MNLNGNVNVKGLNDILNNLNLISLPSSLWGIHIHPKYEYVAIVHVCFDLSSLAFDKGIVVKYNNINNKIEANVYLYSKNVSIPQINQTINSLNDLIQLVFAIDELKICQNYKHQPVDKNSCLITVNSEFDTCVICTQNNYNFGENTFKTLNILKTVDTPVVVWQGNNALNGNLSVSEEVDVVVKEILELEYNNTNQPNHQVPVIQHPVIQTNLNQQQSDADIKCRVCFKSLGSVSARTRHERSHTNVTEQVQTENTNTVHRCTVCAKTFSNVSHLKVHIRSHTGERPFPCKYCHKRFLTNSHLKEHTRIHTGVKPYKCGFCSKENTHQSAHRRHVLTHANLKPNLCNICGKTFCKGYRMEDHLATHSNKRPYKCDLCTKTFSKSFSLRIHRKTHTGIKPHKCKVCGKQYSTQSNLNTHIKSHTGVKPYLCGACPSRFVHPRLLRIHQRMHTGEKPYTCPDCGRSFAKNVHLTVHRRVHSGEKPYICEENNCRRAFTTSGNLNAHRKVHHTPRVKNNASGIGN